MSVDRAWWLDGSFVSGDPWQVAETAAEILGPLLGVAQPLSFDGGALRAVALDQMDPAWSRWLDAVRFVQTHDVDVCRRMARSDRTFRTSADCGQVLEKLNVGAIEIESAVHPFWTPPAGIDTDAFVVLLHLSDSLWLAWDRDHARPVALDRHGRIQSGRPEPASVYPLRSTPHPEMPKCNATARGDRWAAALLPARHNMPRLFTRGDRRWALVRQFGREENRKWLDDLWWLWMHEGIDAMVQHVGAGRMPPRASFASIELRTPTEAVVRWVGDLSVFLLRDCRAQPVTQPHTLGRELASRGEEVRPEHQNMVTRTVGKSTTQVECCVLSLQLGDRLVIADRKFEALGLDALAVGSLRQVVGEIARRGRCEALEHAGVVVIEAGATVTSERTPRITPIMIEEKPVTAVERSDIWADTPLRWPSWRWSWTRGGTAGAAVTSVPPQWRDAMKTVHHNGGVFADDAPQERDILTLRDEEVVWSFEFDGERWSPCAAPNSDSEHVAEGPIQFPEDELASAELDSATSQLPAVAKSLNTLADLATPTHPHRARWLRLLAEQRLGSPVRWLEDARRRVSASFRRSCRRFRFGPDAKPHDIDASDLHEAPTRFDGLRVRYRGMVREGFERMWAAGGWWVPDRGTELGDGWHLVTVEGDVTHDPRGVGHMGLKTLQIEGIARPLPSVAHRRVSEVDLRHGRCRRAVPVLCTIDVRLGLGVTVWNGEPMMVVGTSRPADVSEPVYARIDAVVACAPKPVLLRVQKITDVRPCPAKALSKAVENGDYVVARGLLQRLDDRGWLKFEGPEPRFRSPWRVVPPPISLDRHRRRLAPDWDDPKLARWRPNEQIVATVYGEVLGGSIWATKIVEHLSE